MPALLRAPTLRLGLTLRSAVTALRKLSGHAFRHRPTRALHTASQAMASSRASTPPSVFSSSFMEFGGEQQQPQQQDASLGLIVLNRPLPHVTAHLWQRASLRICADGGANRLHDELPALLPSLRPEAVRDSCLPELIAGDLDSIRPDVVEFYKARGVRFLDLSADQDTNDLDKCLKSMEQLREERGQPRQSYVTVAAGGLGGRLDHTLANLSALYHHRDMRLVLCGDGNLARLIPAGKAVIRPCRAVEGPSCGLVPLRGPAVGYSTGLRWNLDATRLNVGELISTSNIMEADEIHVEADNDMVWMVEYDDEMYSPVID